MQQSYKKKVESLIIEKFQITIILKINYRHSDMQQS